MIKLLRRLNDLPVFDPGRWPKREWISRVVASIAVSLFLAKRILSIPSFPGLTASTAWIGDLLPRNLAPQPFYIDAYYSAFGYSAADIHLLWGVWIIVWLLETSILVGYLAAYLTRDAARSVAKGFMEAVFPMIVAVLPFVISMTPYSFPRLLPPSSPSHFAVLCAIFVLLVVGGTINAVGLYTLRRAFTIMTEARTLIRAGLFRFVRHPLYAGHFVMFLGYTFLHFHAYTVALYGVFVAAQTLRAKIEEAKLSATFPEYEAYKRTTGMFFPRLGRLD